MPHRIYLILALLAVLLPPSSTAFGDPGAESSGNNCLQCHLAQRDGFNELHSFAANNCALCHAGNDKAATQEAAHLELIRFPGNLDNAQQACGGCHADKTSSVMKNLMHTGHGIVDVTRRLVDGSSSGGKTASFQSLEHGVADSMLRKLCASCHLGQSKDEHRLDAMRDRGGGCLACHVNDYPENAHPPLTASVSDARCFGCHSRSGRISLSYAGLAEADDSGATEDQPGLRLPDGRRVERMPPDVHYAAGMACIDCHTAIGLMGEAGDAGHQRQAVDISCTDCHDNNQPRVIIDEWPAEFATYRERIPFAANADTLFLATDKNKSPLWHIEAREDGAWLHTKTTGRILKIPTLDPDYHAEDSDHQRLECAACHSQWVPQCFGCHMEYDDNGTQWDHVEQKETAGRWTEQRSHVRNEPGTLGVNEYNRIELFLPGMIMTVAHPDWDDQKFIRVFAPLSPHTSGRSRSCLSCHRSSVALGLGQGEIVRHSDDFRFVPVHGSLQDGLPADAWTNLMNSLGGHAPLAGQRPFDRREMQAILEATLDGKAN